MKKSSIGNRRSANPFLNSMVAPRAINTGGMSPIGEPLAILPPIVPMARTCFEPSRRRSSPTSGSISEVMLGFGIGRAASERNCLGGLLDPVQLIDAADMQNLRKPSQLLG